MTDNGNVKSLLTPVYNAAHGKVELIYITKDNEKEIHVIPKSHLAKSYASQLHYDEWKKSKS